MSTRSGFEVLGYKFEDDKNDSKKKDVKDIFVKDSTDTPVEISKTVSTNLACDEKVVSHEKKKTEKVFIKKLNKSNIDVKWKIADTQKKVTGKNIGLMTNSQFKKKLGEVTGNPER